MNIKTLTLVAVCCFLVGCAAGVKQITTPSGNKGFLISCDGSADDWSTCFEAATKVCQGKYSIIDKNETSTQSAYGPIVRRHLIAECP